MKINRANYNNIWFTSDWHLQHDRPFIVEDRGFDSIKEHDDFLVSEFNRLVTKDDLVFNMGDFIFGTQDDCKTAMDKLKMGNQFYIIGNHDRALKQYFKYFTKSANKNLGQYSEIKIDHDDELSTCISLSHFAMLSWNKSHYGAWNICGHSHGSLPEALPDNIVGKRLDVSVDVGLKFNDTFMFTLEDVNSIMGGKIKTEHH